METNHVPRHQFIQRLALSRPAEISADVAIKLWEQLASQLIQIIGEIGFTTLYARSLFLTAASIPWPARDSGQTEYRFQELKTSLEGQSPAQASEANSLLLITFTDILASLIGEDLTTSILHLSWGNGDADSDSQN